MKDTHAQFSVLTIFLHWLLAIAMISMLAFGLYLHELPRSPDKGFLIGIHKSVGVLILLVAIFRVYWRHHNGFPKPLSVLTKLQHFLAKLTHWLLLLGTLLMPISGIMMSVGSGRAVAVFGLEIIAAPDNKTPWISELGHIVHSLGGKVLIAFIILHIVAAIKHQWLDKDGTLSRMFGKNISK